MNNSLWTVLIICIAIGALLFIDNIVFAMIKGIDFADAPSYNRAYVNHFPAFLKPILGEEGVLIRFIGALLLIVPGLIFMARHSNTKRQSYLTWGLIGLCVGGVMLWMNL